MHFQGDKQFKLGLFLSGVIFGK